MNTLSREEGERRKTLVDLALAQSLCDGLLAGFDELDAYQDFIQGRIDLIAYRGEAASASENVITALQINAMSCAYPKFMATICVIHTENGDKTIHITPKYESLCVSDFRYSVYELIDPTQRERFYVGYTGQSPILRYQDHLFGRQANIRKVAFKLAKRGIRIGFNIMVGTNSKKEALALEEHYIQQSRQQGLPIVNRTK